MIQLNTDCIWAIYPLVFFNEVKLKSKHAVGWMVRGCCLKSEAPLDLNENFL